MAVEVCVVIGQQVHDAAREVMIDTAERLGCPLEVYGQDYFAFEEHGRVVYQDTDGLMDLPLPALPDPLPGEPHGHVVDELAPARLNWVPVAAPADQVASVVQALSALPDEWDNLWRLAEAQYMSDRQMDDPLWNRGTLSRPQMELVAGRLSLLRQCFF